MTADQFYIEYAMVHEMWAEEFEDDLAREQDQLLPSAATITSIQMLIDYHRRCASRWRRLAG